jgi:cytochrome c553
MLLLARLYHKKRGLAGGARCQLSASPPFDRIRCSFARLPQKKDRMPYFLARTLLVAALALGSHAALAQPKPPADKAPATSESKPATSGKGQGVDNALAMCIGCHGIPGYKTAFPNVYHVPKIAGQSPTYIVNALKAYQSGERSHPSMRGIAASLNEETMKQLAEYYGGTGK